MRKTLISNDGKYELEILSGPDNLGRYAYFIYWDDHGKPYCSTCGKDISRDISMNCTCKEETKQARIFHAPIPEDFTLPPDENESGAIMVET